MSELLKKLGLDRVEFEEPSDKEECLKGASNPVHLLSRGNNYRRYPRSLYITENNRLCLIYSWDGTIEDYYAEVPLETVKSCDLNALMWAVAPVVLEEIIEKLQASKEELKSKLTYLSSPKSMLVEGECLAKEVAPFGVAEFEWHKRITEAIVVCDTMEYLEVKCPDQRFLSELMSVIKKPIKNVANNHEGAWVYPKGHSKFGHYHLIVSYNEFYKVLDKCVRKRIVERLKKVRADLAKLEGEIEDLEALRLH
jgi:hypothetical protein